MNLPESLPGDFSLDSTNQKHEFEVWRQGGSHLIVLWATESRCMGFGGDIAAASRHFLLNHLPQFAQHNSAFGYGNWNLQQQKFWDLLQTYTPRRSGGKCYYRVPEGAYVTKFENQ